MDLDSSERHRPSSISVSPAVISVHLCGLCATLHVKGSVHTNCFCHVLSAVTSHADAFSFMS